MRKPKVYRKIFNEYFHEYGRIEKLREAVIHVDRYLDIIKDDLKQIRRDLISYKGDTLDFFNDRFSTYKIVFELLNESGTYECGISSGRCKNETIFIYVSDDFYHYTSPDMLDVFKIFSEKLCIILAHELVHRGQYYVTKGDKLNFYNFEGHDKVEVNYLQNPRECMAYAYMYIESLRFAGFTNKDILGMIKSGNMRSTRSLYIEFYLKEMKLYDIKTYKRFIKYIYMYLENPIIYNLKIQ